MFSKIKVAIERIVSWIANGIGEGAIYGAAVNAQGGGIRIDGILS